jgi:hypothetical protein
MPKAALNSPKRRGIYLLVIYKYHPHCPLNTNTIIIHTLFTTFTLSIPPILPILHHPFPIQPTLSLYHLHYPNTTYTLPKPPTLLLYHLQSPYITQSPLNHPHSPNNICTHFIPPALPLYGPYYACAPIFPLKYPNYTYITNTLPIPTLLNQQFNQNLRQPMSGYCCCCILLLLL